MQLIFVHGWGYGPEIWTPVLQRLDFRVKTTCVDLGFFHKSSAVDELPEDAVAVGHSFGVMWLLKNCPRPIRKLVSISGFDRFVPHINPRTILVMKKGIERSTDNQLQKFWTACNAPDYKNTAEPDQSRLISGLDQLASWDLGNELQHLDCPVMVLAARDDQITPASMISCIWNEEDIIWSETGGHALPLTRPDWTAEHILEFANESK